MQIVSFFIMVDRVSLFPACLAYAKGSRFGVTRYEDLLVRYLDKVKLLLISFNKEWRKWVISASLLCLVALLVTRTFNLFTLYTPRHNMMNACRERYPLMCLFLFCRRLLGIITKKDVLRHMKQMDSEDPDAVNVN